MVGERGEAWVLDKSAALLFFLFFFFGLFFYPFSTLFYSYLLLSSRSVGHSFFFLSTCFSLGIT